MSDTLFSGGGAPRVSRRTLLRGTGALLALPYLEAMLPASVRAAAPVAKAAKPLRAAFLFVPNGVNMADWTPKTTGAFELPYILEPLKKVKESVTVLSGLTQHNAFALGDGGGDHARSASAWLTGCHPVKTSGANIKVGVSADQIIARRLASKTRFASLELGCERGQLAGECDSGYSCAYSSAISWRSENTPVAKEINPRDVFERLFGSGADGDDPVARARRQAEHRSILDFVLEDANQLKKQLGAHDRQKLDEYFTGVREIEQRIAFTENANKNGGAVKTGASGIVVPTGVPAEYADHVRLMGDMMVLAFQADLTRVCTFMFANEGSGRSYKNLDIADGHHELSHHGKDPEKLAKIRQINRFHVEQLAYVLEKMQAIREGDSTLLDNTMLVYGGGISDGDRHNHDDLPILVAGGAGGAIKGNQHIAYPNETPMSNLFLSMFDRMGIPAETVGSIGDSTGRLQQIL